MRIRIPSWGWALAIVALSAGAQSPAPDAAAEFKVYPLGFVEPEVAETAAQTLAGHTGRVILDRPGGRVLLWASPTAHTQFADLLRQLNVPPVNVRIEVEFVEHGQTSDSHAGIGLDGGVIFRDGDAEARGRITGTFDQRHSESRESVRQILLVASGREASLAVGEDVPYLAWINQCGLGWSLYAQEIQWQKVGAFLVVQPTVLPDGRTLRIRLIPELSGLVEGQPHRVRYTRAATEIIAVNGRAVSLAGHGEQREFYERFLVGVGRSGSQRAMDLRLTPTLMPPLAAPAPPGASAP